MLKQLDAQNILAFLERVTVTGPREAGEYMRCCQLLAAIAQTPQEEGAPAVTKPTLVQPVPAAE
jgi:hypothetical protein